MHVETGLCISHALGFFWMLTGGCVGGWLCGIFWWRFSVKFLNLEEDKRNFYPGAKTKIFTVRCSLDVCINLQQRVLELPCNSGVLDPSACRLNTLRTVLE